MKFNTAWVIFMVGMAPLVLAYYPLKEAVSPWEFVLIALVYLLCLRVFSDWLAIKMVVKRKTKREQD